MPDSVCLAPTVPQLPDPSNIQQQVLRALSRLHAEIEHAPSESRISYLQTVNKYAEGYLKEIRSRAVPQNTGLDTLAAAAAAAASADPDDSNHETPNSKATQASTSNSSADRPAEPPPPRRRRRPTSADGQPALSPTKKRRRHTSEPPSKALIQIKHLGLSSNLDVSNLDHARHQFHTFISKFAPQIRRNNKQIYSQFSEEDALSITSFFFDDCLGPQSFERILDLAEYWQSHGDDQVDVGTGARAAQLSVDNRNPEPIRQFFRSYSRAHRNSMNHPTYASLMQTIDDVELFHAWSRLNDLAARKDPDVQRCFDRYSLRTSRGRDSRSLVKEFLKLELELKDETALQNRCQAAQGIANLVEEFGRGVLILLPPNAGNKLNRWGNQRMAEVYKALRHVEHFGRFCKDLEDAFYTPIVTGHAIATVLHRPTVEAGTPAAPLED